MLIEWTIFFQWCTNVINGTNVEDNDGLTEFLKKSEAVKAYRPNQVRRQMYYKLKNFMKMRIFKT